MRDAKPVQLVSEFLPDLVHHLFAHMSFDHVSCLYDPVYVESFRRRREGRGGRSDLPERMGRLGEIYARWRETLFFLEFWPYVAPSRQAYEDFARQKVAPKSEETRIFVDEFLRILDEEWSFYHDYWTRRNAEDRESIESFERLLNAEDSPVAFFNAVFEESLVVHRCLSLLKYGRGVDISGGRVVVAVKSPAHPAELRSSLLVAMHELTHMSLSSLQDDYEAAEGLRSPGEKAAIVYGYLLLKEHFPDYLGPYFEELSRWLGTRVEESNFRDEFLMEESAFAAMRAKYRSDCDAFLQRRRA